MMSQAYFWLKNFLGQFSREEGQGLVEYALILVLIAIVVIVALKLLGGQVSNVFETITGNLGGVAPEQQDCAMQLSNNLIKSLAAGTL